jgi:hypothetical protein
LTPMVLITSSSASAARMPIPSWRALPSPAATPTAQVLTLPAAGCTTMAAAQL